MANRYADQSPAVLHLAAIPGPQRGSRASWFFLFWLTVDEPVPGYTVLGDSQTLPNASTQPRSLSTQMRSRLQQQLLEPDGGFLRGRRAHSPGEASDPETQHRKLSFVFR